MQNSIGTLVEFLEVDRRVYEEECRLEFKVLISSILAVMLSNTNILLNELKCEKLIESVIKLLVPSPSQKWLDE